MGKAIFKLKRRIAPSNGRFGLGDVIDGHILDVLQRFSSPVPLLTEGKRIV